MVVVFIFFYFACKKTPTADRRHSLVPLFHTTCFIFNTFWSWYDYFYFYFVGQFNIFCYIYFIVVNFLNFKHTTYHHVQSLQSLWTALPSLYYKSNVESRHHKIVSAVNTDCPKSKHLPSKIHGEIQLFLWQRHYLFVGPGTCLPFKLWDHLALSVNVVSNWHIIMPLMAPYERSREMQKNHQQQWNCCFHHQ